MCSRPARAHLDDTLQNVQFNYYRPGLGSCAVEVQ
jgi:hypothetical protein